MADFSVTTPEEWLHDLRKTLDKLRDHNRIYADLALLWGRMGLPRR